mmetsp:Transcript_40819/g.104013  ORF Transcript_40819/g.104013 Transcript_40819/m.104013 type:complete len:223 (+) Transcript_40819:1-669(+)
MKTEHVDTAMHRRSATSIVRSLMLRHARISRSLSPQSEATSHAQQVKSPMAHEVLRSRHPHEDITEEFRSIVCNGANAVAHAIDADAVLLAEQAVALLRCLQFPEHHGGGSAEAGSVLLVHRHSQHQGSRSLSHAIHLQMAAAAAPDADLGSRGVGDGADAVASTADEPGDEIKAWRRHVEVEVYPEAAVPRAAAGWEAQEGSLMRELQRLHVVLRGEALPV